MPKISAGLLLYKKRKGRIEVFLAHLGGPWWEDKDFGAWSIPKGELEEEDDPDDLLALALREFEEEIGMPAPEQVKYMDLGSVRQRSGKKVFAFAGEGRGDEKFVESNLFPLEWPPGSGRTQEFPEMDGADYIEIGKAYGKMHGYLRPFLDRLKHKLESQQKKLF